MDVKTAMAMIVVVVKVVMMVMSQIELMNQQNKNMCYVCGFAVVGALPFLIVFHRHYIALCIFTLYCVKATNLMRATYAERGLQGTHI
jgi:hypothetical protein